MTNILTNISAMIALQTIKGVNSSISTTEKHVSSGLRVGEAKDDVAYWFISSKMNSSSKSVAAASDALGIGVAKVDTAYAAAESAIGVVNEIKSKLVTAREQSADLGQIQLEIGKLQDQLSAIAKGASFSGDNWMVRGAAAAVTIVDGLISAPGGGISVSNATFNLASYAMFDAIVDDVGTGGALGSLMNVVLNDNSTPQDIADFMTTTERALGSLIGTAAALGALQTHLQLQGSFASKLSDAIERGTGRLVDADLGEESAISTALQARQQLALQSLSIANARGDGALSILRG